MYEFTNPQGWEEQAQFIKIGDYSLASWISHNPSPDKPYLLLIHGFPTSSWDWSALWQSLEQHFNLAALDMLGFGLSDKPQNHKYSLIEQADLIENFLGQNNIKSAHILSHDYGVSVAQELLARFNENTLSFNLQSICFLNEGLFPDHHRPRAIQKLSLTPLGPFISAALSKQRLEKSFNAIFGVNTKPSNFEIDSHWHFMTHNAGTKIFHKVMRYMIDRRIHAMRWRNAMVNTDVPLRLINGGQDPISGKHLYEHYCEIIPNADAILLPEIGHYPHTENPDAIYKAFIEFHALT